MLEVLRGAPRTQRRHFIATDGTDVTDPAAAIQQLASFWSWVPGERTAIRSTPLELLDQRRLGDLGLKFWRVDHSIPGSAAWGIETPIGWVIYSGDLRMHGHSRQRTEKFVKEAKALKPALLIIEGTRVDQSDPVTEPDVHQAADEVVRQAEGVVIADFTARNIERLRTFRDIATARSRRLVVTTEDAYMLEHLHVVDPNIPHPASEGRAILDEPQGSVPSWEKDVRQRLGGNLVSAASIRQLPGSYILCLWHWDITYLVAL